MPRYDGTGPEGKGLRTGRQMGNCKGAKTQEDRPVREQGLGAGRRPRGTGRGLGRKQGN